MIYATLHLTITNPDAMAKYREKPGAALAKHGGAMLAASPTPTRMDGTQPLPTLVGVLSFPDKAAALGWINDPELTDLHALRRAAGSSDIVLIG